MIIVGSGKPVNGAFTPFMSSLEGQPENVPNTGFPLETSESGTADISRVYKIPPKLFSIYFQTKFDYVQVGKKTRKKMPAFQKSQKRAFFENSKIRIAVDSRAKVANLLESPCQ